MKATMVNILAILVNAEIRGPRRVPPLRLASHRGCRFLRKVRHTGQFPSDTGQYCRQFVTCCLSPTRNLLSLDQYLMTKSGARDALDRCAYRLVGAADSCNPNQVYRPIPSSGQFPDDEVRSPPCARPLHLSSRRGRRFLETKSGILVNFI